MATNRTITFSIEGKDNLSAALKSAADKIKSLADFNKSINAKALAQANRLQQAQAQLQNLNAYRKLQQAQAQAQKAYIGLSQDMGKVFARRKAEAAQLESMRQAYDRLQQAYKDNKRTMSAAQASAMKDALKSAKSELKAQENLIKGLDKSYDNAAASIAKLKTQLATQQAQLTQARAGLPSGTLAAHEMQLRAQIQQTTNALNAEIAALERRNQIANNFATANQNLSNAYSNFQNAVDTAQTIMNPFVNATDKAIEFQHTMSTLKSISQMDLINAGKFDEAEANMRRLTAQAKELGATTIFKAQEVGEAQVFVARAGWDTDSIEKAMPSILHLAAANRMAIEPTADILTNIMTAFGATADEVGRYSDVLNYTVTHSNQNLMQMGEALKYSAPVAKLFGASIEEAAMMTKFMADAGIQGSMAGTSMRQTMIRLTAPPKKASKAMDELGVSTSDATKAWNEAQEVAASYGVTLDSTLGAGRQFISIMEQIDRGFVGKSDREKLAALSAITGINAVSGAANLFGAGATQAKNFTELLENCRGSLDQTYKVMTDDTFGAQKSFESAWEAVQLSVGESLLGITKAAYEFATPFMTSLSQFIDNNPKVVQGLAAIAAAVSTATVALAGFSLAMAAVRFTQAGIATAGLLFTDLAAKVTTAMTALRGLTLANIGASLSSGLTAASNAARLFGAAMMTAARSALMFVFTPVGAALTAIALAAYYAYQNWDKVSAAFSTIGDALSSSLVPAIESAMQAFSTLGTAFAPIGNLVGSLINYIGGGLCGAFIGLAGVVGSVLSSIVVGLAGVLKSVAELGSGIVDAIGKISEGDFAGAWDSLKSSAVQAAESYKSAWTDSFATIKDGILATNDAINQFAASPPSTVSDKVSAGLSALPAIDTAQVVQPLADASTQAADSLNQVSMPAEATGQSLTQLPPSIDAVTASTQAVSPQLDALSAALPQPIGGLEALGGAAQNCASALESACAKISSIQINVPQINYVPMSVPVAKNAEGGIYHQGAFLTTFAENSGEAAIPLDSSARSKSLWLETGNLLGMFNDGQSSSAPINISMTVHVSGDSDKETAEKVWQEALKPRLEDFAEQLRSYEHEKRRRSFN